MRSAGIVSLIIAGTLVGDAAEAIPQLSPFINELHYDNSGPDIGEFVEIAGSAQSLLGFSLFFYNGGNGRSYRNITLDAAIPNESSGFGAVALTISGLQNGPADGIALVDSMNNVLDWLSYEGELLAVDGPAAGQRSNAISVSEAPTTLAGLSLQRQGIGVLAEDFDWAGPMDNSPGFINLGQQFADTPISIDEPNPLLLLGVGLWAFLLVRRFTSP